MWWHPLLVAIDDNPVVIVPTGSVEQHGPHCPLDVDISRMQATAIETVRYGRVSHDRHPGLEPPHPR